jgi:hypothetical protein
MSDFITLNGDIIGSLNISGSLGVGSVLNLSPFLYLPSGSLGDLVVSGSNLYFYNGTGWGEVMVNPLPTPTPTPTPTVGEPTINFNVKVDGSSISNNISAVLGGSANMNVELTNGIPTAGVTIDTIMKKVADGSTIFTNSLSSNNLNNSITITGFLTGVLYETSVVVTSKTLNMSSNTQRKTFKIARK